MNHRRPRDTSWSYDDTLQSFTVQSLREMEMNEEVFDSYGKKCNSRYLLNYGFTVLDNTGVVTDQRTFCI
jgi:protein-histidine N-methyltransferase